MRRIINPTVKTVAITYSDGRRIDATILKAPQANINVEPNRLEFLQDSSFFMDHAVLTPNKAFIFTFLIGCHFERYFAHILNTILHEMKYKNLSSCKR